MKNFKKLFICLTAIVLFITSCKDNTLEEIQYVAGMKCLEKTFEEYQNGKFISKRINEYDNQNNRIKTVYSSANNSTTTSLLEYNQDNSIKSVTYDNGAITKYEYDSNKKLVKVYVSDNDYTIYEYHSNNKTKKITWYLTKTIVGINEFDENGYQTRRYNAVFQYDDFGQNPTIKIINETEIATKYDSKGNLLNEYITHDKSFFSSTESEYNEFNELIKRTSKDLKKTTITNRSYERDANKRLIRVKYDNGAETTFEYNNQGLLITKTDFYDSKLAGITKNEYNSSQQLINVSTSDSKGIITSKSVRVYYSNNTLKSIQSYSLKTSNSTELYRFSEYEANVCGNLLKSIGYNVDGSENRRAIATYLYR